MKQKILNLKNSFLVLFSALAVLCLSLALYFTLPKNQTSASAAIVSGNTATLITPDFEFNGDTYVGISSSIKQNLNNYTSVIIDLPDNLQVNGTYITKIGEGAFADITNITEVRIANTITTIGANAFSGCTGLKTLTIGEGVTAIDDDAFSGCTGVTTLTYNAINCSTSAFNNSSNFSNLTTLTIGEKIESLPYFYVANLTKLYFNAEECNDFPNNSAGPLGAIGNASGGADVTFGEKVKKVPNYLFFYSSGGSAKKIKTVSFAANSVCTTIGQSAFNGAGSVTSVEIPVNVTEIGSGAFIKSNNIAELTYNAKNCQTTVFQDHTTIQTLTIGEEVETLADNVFNGCTGIKSIEIPDSVTSIGNSAFRGCTSVESVTIGTGVTSIGDYAFNYLDNLKTINFNATNCEDCKSSPSGPFICNDANVTFGANVKRVPGFLFFSTSPASNLENVSFAEGSACETIGYMSFGGSTKISNMTIPPSVTEIVNPSFSNITNLTYNAANCQTTVFKDNTTIKTLTLGNTVTSIGANAFSGLTGLTELTYNAKCSNFTSSTYAFGNSGADECTLNIGANVTAIPNYTFYNSNISTVTIPNSVTTIGSSAFEGCNSLTSVNISNNITSLGNSAFKSCNNLETVTIGNGLETISNSAFESCTSLKNLTIGNNVNTIDTSAFYGCHSLEELYLPDSVTKINTIAFYSCNSLTEIEIPNSVTSLGTSVFAYCKNLATVSIGTGVTGAYESGETIKINNNAFDNSPVANLTYNAVSCSTTAFKKLTSLTTLTIGEDVTALAADAFDECTGLRTLNFNAANYTETCFDNNTYIKTLNIGEKVTTITDSAFSGCTGLTTVTFADNSECTLIKTSAFKDCAALTNINIPYGVTSIGQYAFQNCSSLTSIIIPASVESIDASSFESCVALTTLTLNEGLTSINDWAFKNCDSLTEITIPDSVTEIGISVFEESDSIQTVKFGAGLTEITEYMFQNCPALATITIPDNIKTIDILAFNGCTSLATVLIGTGVKGAYESGETIIISSNAFDSCPIATLTYNAINCKTTAFQNKPSLTTLTIGEGVKELGESIFSGLTGLTTLNYNAEECSALEDASNVFTDAGKNSSGIAVTFGGLVKAIPNNLFYIASTASNSFAPKIITVDFGENSICESIGAYAFCNCTLLQNLTLPDSLTEINSAAFENCTSITTIIIPDKVTLIGDRVFSGCSSLEEVTIGKAVTEIGNMAFGGATADSSTKITSIVIPDSVTSIGTFAFANCSLLTSVTLPENEKFETIQNSAFSYCSSLTNIKIPQSVKTINNAAFSYCSSLTSIDFTNGLTSIGSTAFLSCGLEEVIIPDSVKEIAAAAFNICLSLKKVTIGTGVIGAYSNGETIKINNYAFNSCPIEILNYNAINCSTTEFRDKAAIKTLTIGDSVESISASTFNGLIGLTELNFNATNCADFAYGSGLFNKAGQSSDGITVNFGKEVPKIPQYLFHVMTQNPNNKEPKITKVAFEEDSRCTEIGDGAFNGCKELTEIILPEGVTSIGFRAFENCKFASFVIPEGVTIINTGVFQSCSELTKIIIPDNVTLIDENAFLSCVKLASVTIGADVEKINNLAFSGCKALTSIIIPNGVASLGNSVFSNSGLTIIKIPNSVTSLGNNVFLNCADLKTVYLPESVVSRVPVTYGQQVFDKINTDAVIISASYNAYNKDIVTANLNEYANQITYIVNVNLLDQNNVKLRELSEEVIERLYNKSYQFTRNDDDSWSIDESVKLPKPEGFISVVWRFNGLDGEAVSTVSKLSTALENLAEEINLYAVSRPQDTYSITYNYDGVEHELRDILQNYSDPQSEDYKSEYYIFDYLTAPDGNTIYEVREEAYNLTANLDENEYGEWEEPVNIQVKVQKSPLNLFQNGAIEWTVIDSEGNPVEGNNLKGGTLYVYQDKACVSQEGEGGLKFNVTNSYVRYTGNDITIQLVPENEYITVEKSSALYEKNVENGIGIYTSTAIVEITSDNYNIFVGDDVNPSRGLNIEPLGGGKYKITKTWYIVSMPNYLAEAAGSDKDYKVAASYEYRSVNLPMPYLYRGDQDNIEFTLTFNDRSCTSGREPLSRLHYYVNEAMPVGEYRITFFVKAFSEIIDGESTALPAFDSSYEFTVTPKALSQEQINAINNVLKDKEYMYKADGNVHFYDKVAETALATLLGSKLNADRQGTYWAQANYSSLYGNFEITFNLNRSKSNVYYNASAYGQGDLLRGGMTPDTYVVYYQLSAPNYQSLVNAYSDARRDCQFTVIIWDEVEVPNVGGVTYTYNGSEIKPAVASNQLYKIIWTDTDYTNATVHTFTLELYDSEHYSWKETEGVEIINGKAVVSYTINSADNRWTLTPKLSGWVYGSYDATVNVITSTALYAGEGTKYSIYDAKGNVVEGLSNFTLEENGQISAALASKFNNLPTGTYKLLATVKGDGNWNDLEISFEDARDFTITSAVNGWKVSLDIIDWYYNEYDKAANKIFGETYFGTVTFTVKDSNGNVCIENITLTDGLVSDEVAAKLNNLSHGTYSLIASVSKDESSYTSVNDAVVSFKVESAPNYWEKIPDIVGWTENNFDKTKNFVIAEARHGNDTLVIVIKDEDGNVLEYTDINELFASLEIGTYTLCAYVEGTSDYSALDGEITFVVSEDAVSLRWLQIALAIFIVFDIVAAGVVITILIFRKRKIEAEFRDMVHTELNRGSK